MVLDKHIAQDREVGHPALPVSLMQLLLHDRLTCTPEMHRSAYTAEAFQARSAMGTPYRTPLTMKNRLGTSGQEMEQGTYQTPDLARIDPWMNRWMPAAAVSDVMISEVWCQFDCPQFLSLAAVSSPLCR